jgi:hypothetical protein
VHEISHELSLPSRIPSFLDGTEHLGEDRLVCYISANRSISGRGVGVFGMSW